MSLVVRAELTFAAGFASPLLPRMLQLLYEMGVAPPANNGATTMDGDVSR
ncbi:hypothetical protein [Allorhizobium terrae]|nr:hypothetical protein [Allorhizobium terrae]